MAPRVPGRPKAADIPTEEILIRAAKRQPKYKAVGCFVEDYSDLAFPSKVIEVKLQKLEHQGLIERFGPGSSFVTLTPKGKAYLEERKAPHHA